MIGLVKENSSYTKWLPIALTALRNLKSSVDYPPQ